MYSRANRRTSFHKELTPQAVGPGSYENLSGKKLNPGFAGFGVSESRKLDTKENPSKAKTAPGPGSYLQREYVEREKNPKSNVFKSRVARLAPQTVGSSAFVEGMVKDNPGPGSYQATSDFQQRTSNQHSTASLSILGNCSAHTAELVQLARPGYNPPAIPRPTHGPSTFSHSDGYESKADGIGVVPLHNSSVIHTGIKGDTVGPGQYNMPGAFTDKTGPKMEGYASRKPIFYTDANPGPGEYNPGLPKYVRTVRTKGTSAFASSIPMTQDRAVDPNREHLGPGAYLAKPFVKPETEQMPLHFQNFGSNQRRSGWNRNECAPYNDVQNQVPAPGEYGNYSSFKRPVENKLTDEVVGFGMKSERPCLAPTKAGVLGPGQYEVQHASITSSVKKKVVGRNGVFGTTTARFNTDQLGNVITTGSANPSGITNESPAPMNSYEAPAAPPTRPGRNVRRPKQPLSSFKSDVERFNPLAPRKFDMHIVGKDAVPPVGTYDVESAYNFAKNARGDSFAKSSVESSFLAKSTRFDEKRTFELKLINTAPGPGSYNPNKNKVFKKAVKPVIGTSMRFENPEVAAASLGPGSYGSTENSLLKKTFNITFTEKKKIPEHEQASGSEERHTAFQGSSNQIQASLDDRFGLSYSR